MRPNGVRTLLATAFVLAAIPAVTEAAVAPPKCWKGKAGCRHTSTPHWNLRTFTGTADVNGTRPNSLTCADVQQGPRDEIVAGHYTVKMSLKRSLSQTRIGADANKNPITSKPLQLSLLVTGTTHERVRTLTSNGNGTCAETFRDCDRTDQSTKQDTLDLFVRSRSVIQETPGDWIKSAFIECAETPTTPSLLPDDPLDAKFMSERSSLRIFRHPDTTVTHGRDRQIGDGNTSIAVSGKLTYARSIRACTTYPLTKTRCRTAKG
jgi:hypothetical protein